MVGVLSLDCSMTQEQFEKSHWNEQTQGPIPTFIESKIEVLDSQMLPDSGAYYVYSAADYREKTLSPENKLRRLYVIGFNITMAWYRQPLGGCQKPGTDAITKTMYPEFLLLRLSMPNELLEKYNFRLIERPKYFPCPYNVSFYLPRVDK
jgi:hypothetical protein